MQPGTARSLRVVLLVVMATVLVVALGRLVGASPRAAIPEILEPPSPVVPTPAPQSDTSLVQTAAGTVRGKVEWDHRLFADIPYAAPPVGPLRFRSPAPAQPWEGIRDATEPGPRCIQDPGADPEFGKQSDEDCLNLNVWTPAMKGSPRPVMVWIHGGSFTGGTGKTYDGRWLVSRGDVIVVTINYRLGTLGFLAHPALGPPGDVGNYGLQDQQAALRWVRDNIANFGGDPAKVTVAGESAGGMSVCDHLVAPGSKGLFRAAIIQSAPCGAQADLPTAEQRSVDYATKAGCGDPATAADCLRALPLDKLREPVTFYNIGDDALPGPVTGSAALPVDPVTAMAENNAARVPVPCRPPAGRTRPWPNWRTGAGRPARPGLQPTTGRTPGAAVPAGVAAAGRGRGADGARPLESKGSRTLDLPAGAVTLAACVSLGASQSSIRSSRGGRRSVRTHLEQEAALDAWLVTRNGNQV